MANYYWVGGTATWDATAGSKWADASGGTNYYTTPPTSTDDVYFDANSGVVTVSIGFSRVCKNLDFTGFTGTFNASSSGSITQLTGNLVLGSSMTWIGGASITFTGTNNTTINANGISIDNPITLNKTSGYSLTLNSDFNIVSAGTSRAFIHTNGDFYVGANTLTIGSITNTNTTNSRTFDCGSGIIKYMGSILMNASTSTLNFVKGTGIFEYIGNVAGSINFNMGSREVYQIQNNATGLSTTIIFTGVTCYRTSISSISSLTLSYTLSDNTDLRMYKDEYYYSTVYGTGITLNSSTAYFSNAGHSTIRVGSAYTPSFTVNYGELNLSNSLTIHSILSNNSNIRTINITNCTLNIVNTITFNNSTNLNFISTNSIINMINTVAFSFNGGGMTFNKVSFLKGTSTSSITITGSNTFNELEDTGSASHSIIFTAGTTTIVNADTGFKISGTTGNQITITSSTTSPFNLSCSSGDIRANYLNISYSNVTGGATWYASKTTNTDSGNNTGWIFLEDIFNISTGTYYYTGKNWNNIYNRILNFSRDNYLYLGKNWNNIYNRILNFTKGTYTYTGFNFVLKRLYQLIINTGSYIYSGIDFFLKKTYAKIINTGSYIYSGINFGKIYSRIFAFAKGTYTYTGFNWIMQKVFAFVFSTGSYTYNGFNFILKATRQFLWSTGEYAYTGFNWLNIRLYQLLINTSSYVYTGFNFSYEYLRKIIINTGSYVYTGSNYFLTLTRYVLFNAGSYSVTGFNFIFTALRKIIIGTISYIYNGFNVRIKGTGDLAWLKKNNDDGQNWGKTIKDDGSNWSKSTLDTGIWAETPKDSGSGWNITSKDSENWTITPKN